MVELLRNALKISKPRPMGRMVKLPKTNMILPGVAVVGGGCRTGFGYICCLEVKPRSFQKKLIQPECDGHEQVDPTKWRIIMTIIRQKSIEPFNRLHYSM